jgi:AraC-like DNA-binding protein
MSSRSVLADAIARIATTEGCTRTGIPRLSLFRTHNPTEPMHVVHNPAVAIIAQGAKQVMLGDETFNYDADTYLVVSVDLPMTGRVTRASKDEPYLCLKLELDPAMLGALIVESGAGDPASRRDGPGLILSRTSAGVIEAATRLVRLAETPEDIPVLAPLMERELLYRLLRGEQGARLAQIAFAESRLNQVNRAIGLIKKRFREPIRIDDVAAEARMSPSALHLHFKAVTAMSPLQFQKQLRLQEARALMLSGRTDAAGASHQVGYESASQFSREYARLFGAPPMTDVSRLRNGEEAVSLTVS